MNQTIAHSLAKNTTVMMSSQLITWVSSFILMLVLPRSLGSEEYGRLYLAMSFTLMFQILIDFGGPYYIAKEIARGRGQALTLVVHSLALRLLLWVVSLATMIVFCHAVDYSSKVTTLILILGVAKLWESATRVFNSSFQGFEMMEYVSVGSVTERVSVTVACLVMLMMGADVVAIAVVMAFSTLLNFSVEAVFARKLFLRSIPGIQWRAVGELAKKGIPYFLYAIFAVVYYRVDAVMLSLMTTDIVVGWYGVAHRFFDVLMFLPSILATVVFPVLSRLNGVQ
ncbi:MAG: oligosaccharide flippase family protein, partial [Bacteroidota bacterium]